MPYSDRSMKLGDHIPNWLLFEKDVSRKLATVPISGSRTKGDGDHANVAIQCISSSFVAVFKREVGGTEGKGWEKSVGWRK